MSRLAPLLSVILHRKILGLEHHRGLVLTWQTIAKSWHVTFREPIRVFFR